MKIFTLLFLFSTGLILTSCRKHSSSDSPAKGPFLYIGGTASSKGVFWKKSLSQEGAALVADTLTGAGSITTILNSGSDVYMAAQRGGYWINNSFVVPTGASYISNITRSDNIIYATGWDNTGTPAYWRSNTKISLENPAKTPKFPYQGVSSVAIDGIAVSGSNVLIAGSLFFRNQPGAPAGAVEGNFGLLWENGSFKLFESSGIIIAHYITTAGIAISGSDVYVAGRFPDTIYTGGYWKNGVWNSINNGAFQPASITTSGNTVYIPGATFIRTPPYSQQAAYWANGSITHLNGRVAFAIAVDGSDIYALGIDDNNKVVVWKNGNVFVTIGPASEVGAACMSIGD